MAVFAKFVRYFDEVVRRGSIRGAAERLNIASSAIDRQILKVEEELDAPLFERLPQGMRLTAAGEHMIVHVRRWQREFDQVKAQIGNLRGLQGGRVTIAIAETLSGNLIARYLTGFRDRYPRVAMVVHVASTHVPDLVLAGDADVGLTFTSTTNRMLRVERSIALGVGAVVLPNHPLAAHKRVHLRECAEFPLILPDETKMLRSAIEIGSARAGLDLHPAVVAGNFNMMKAFVTNGLGVALLCSADVYEEVRHGTLTFVPLADRSIPPSFLSLITGPNPSVIASQLTQWLGRAMDDLETA
jgi:DNA-binding transcriptional LysR family regulator